MAIAASTIGEILLGISVGLIVSILLLGAIFLWCNWSPRIWDHTDPQ